jgi:LysM repeat protein
MFKDIRILNNSNENFSSKPEKEEEKKEKKEPLNRRTFLKAGIAMGALYGIGKMLGNQVEKLADQKFFDESSDVDGGYFSDEEMLARIAKANEKNPTEEQSKIEDDDRIAIGDTIREQLETGNGVKLDMSTKKAFYEKWSQSYGKRPDDLPNEEANKWMGSNHLGLLQAMEKMQPWIGAIKAEFVKVGVPEKFAYIAIPESHFDLEANSRKSAEGPYQFTEGTAKIFGLTIEEGIDQRRDPVKSAKACAEHLKYSYERFNDDWDLAFSDYNGAFTKEYAKFRPVKKDRNYKDYLAWREERINEFIARESFEHIVEKKDKNLSTIASYYKLSVEDLLQENGLAGHNIRIGQKLKLPATTSVKTFKLRDSLENLNYPEKFYAVLDVIEKEGLEKRFPELHNNLKLIKVPKVATTEFLYRVEKGDVLSGIALKIQSNIKRKNPKVEISTTRIQKMIQSQNGIEDSRKIRSGQKLKVTLPLESGMSLAKIATKNNIPFEKLAQLNPAIIEKEMTLPIGTEIRLPR